MRLTDDKGQPVMLGARLGGGGEGDVFEVVGEPDRVAKMYHQPTADRARKLQAMLQNPPPDPSAGRRHVSICWPQRLLHRQGACVGFLMHRVSQRSCVELLKLYTPLDRVSYAPSFTWKYLLRAAANLASVVDALHARGYVVGDLNESNVLVTTSALVVIVDCDSMQVPIPGRRGFYHCPVGKPELTAPELQSARNLALVDRTPAHDCFALAVMLFLTVMEGVHPFAGVWKARGDDPPLSERIERGDSPYAGSRKVDPMPAALPLDILPEPLRRLFEQCFRAGIRSPGARPSARQWRDALTAAEGTLLTCGRNSQHVYPQHNRACPWCKRTALLGGYDPYPAPGAAPQTPLRPAPAFSGASPGPGRTGTALPRPPPVWPATVRPATMPGALAGRRARLAAVLVDATIVPACFLPLMIGGLLNARADAMNTEGVLTSSLLGVLVIWQLVLLYRHGQTLGKRMMGVRILGIDGTRASVRGIVLWRVLVAGLPWVIPYLGQLYALIDVLMIFGSSRRCLHDRIAGSQVVAAPQVAPPLGRRGLIALLTALSVLSLIVALR